MEEFLEMGSTGEKVRQLQAQLKRGGYEIKVDGIFGEETRAAVIDFQNSYGLVPDGIVSLSTFFGRPSSGILTGIIAIKEHFSPSPTPKPKPKPK